MVMPRLLDEAQASNVGQQKQQQQQSAANHEDYEVDGSVAAGDLSLAQLLSSILL
jgi:hypothetical protein